MKGLLGWQLIGSCTIVVVISMLHEDILALGRVTEKLWLERNIQLLGKFIGKKKKSTKTRGSF